MSINKYLAHARRAIHTPDSVLSEAVFHERENALALYRCIGDGRWMWRAAGAGV
jgi:hypothetical protein